MNLSSPCWCVYVTTSQTSYLLTLSCCLCSVSCLLSCVLVSSCLQRFPLWSLHYVLLCFLLSCLSVLFPSCLLCVFPSLSHLSSSLLSPHLFPVSSSLSVYLVSFVSLSVHCLWPFHASWCFWMFLVFPCILPVACWFGFNFLHFWSVLCWDFSVARCSACFSWYFVCFWSLVRFFCAPGFGGFQLLIYWSSPYVSSDPASHLICIWVEVKMFKC